MVIIKKNIMLDADDIALTPSARRRMKIKKTAKFLGLCAIPLLLFQTLTFVSFIYQEALQAQGFAVRAALDAEDQVVAYHLVKDYESIMKKAQKFQRFVGFGAFWTHGAYKAYFFVAAPSQLLGFYSEGKKKNLWGEDVRRFVKVDQLGRETFVDTWIMNPRERMGEHGFDPEIISNWGACLECEKVEHENGLQLEKTKTFMKMTAMPRLQKGMAETKLQQQ